MAVDLRTLSYSQMYKDIEDWIQSWPKDIEFRIPPNRFMVKIENDDILR